jgi:tetratricopeptide (TPR) repeat protein
MFAYESIRGILAALLAALVLGAGVARADDAEYDGLIRNALSEYDAGRYEEAAALFGRAHAISPNARTHRGLGLSFYEARKYALAVRHLRAALQDQRRPLTADMKSSAQKVLRQAEGFVATVHVALDPSDATLEVDGHPAELEGNELLLDPGQHELIARAPDHAQERRIVEAISGSTSDLQLTLGSADEAAAQSPEMAPPQAQPTSTPAPATSSGLGVGPYIVMGAGGALLIGSLVTGLMANSLHSDLEKRCKPECMDDDVASDKKKGKTLVTVTNVLLAGGLVTAAAGAAWLIIGSMNGGQESSTQVAAVCLGDGCAAAVTGRF